MPKRLTRQLILLMVPNDLMQTMLILIETLIVVGYPKEHGGGQL